MGVSALQDYPLFFHILARSFGFFLAPAEITPFLLLGISALFAENTRGVSGTISALASCKAREKETEEGVGIGVEADLGVRGIGGVGLARVGARKTSFVDTDMPRLYGAQSPGDPQGVIHSPQQSALF